MKTMRTGARGDFVSAKAQEAERRVRSVLTTLILGGLSILVILGAGILASERHLETSAAVESADRWARLAADLIGGEVVVGGDEGLDSALLTRNPVLDTALNEGHLISYRIASLQGTIIVSSQVEDIGAALPDDLFERLRDGQSIPVHIDVLSGAPLPSGIAAVYMPINRDGTRIGYIGIRVSRSELTKGFFLALRYGFAIIVVVTLIFGSIGIRYLHQDLRRRVELEQQLVLALEASLAVVWDWNITAGIFHTSQRMTEILGLDPETHAFSLAEHDARCHPDDLQGVRRAFRAHLESGVPYDTEYRLQHHDGHYIWIHSQGQVVQRIKGTPTRMVGTITDVTARKLAEVELKRNRETLDMAFSAAQAGYFDYSVDTNEVFWSPRLREILGITDPGFVPEGASFSARMHSEDKPEFLEALSKYRAGGKPLDIEVRLRHEKGHYVWVHVRARGGVDETGRMVRSIGFVLDITKSKEAQSAMMESERKFRDLIEGSIQGLVIHRNFKPLFCNEAYAHMLGYDRADQVLALDTLLTHLPPGTKSRADEFWDRALTRKIDGVHMRLKTQHVSGRMLWFDAVGRLIQWEGEPAFQMVLVDMTEQQQFEDAMKASEERFRLLADNSSDIIALFDSGGLLRYLSPSVERLSGYKPEELIGEDIMSRVHPDDKQRIEDRRHKIVKGEIDPLMPVVWRLIKKDGSFAWMESLSTHVPDPAAPGEFQTISTLREVTERVEREAEISAARDRLQSQTEKLAFLAQNLELERERAEQANAAKSQFLAMMSHELRTPMTGILGMADLLLMTKPSQEQERYVRQLTRSARVLLDILNDILDFSKIEAGQLQIENIPFRVSEIVNDVRGLFANTASEKGIALAVQMPDPLHDAVIGDPKRLRQVLTNLVNNAVKFTEKGRIEIRLDQQFVSDDEMVLGFKVSDSGIGIAPGNIEKLFQPFVQEDISTSRKYGGTGLGLAITKRLVEAMGGDISVSSEMGTGSTFAFSVWVTADRNAEAVAAPLPAAPALPAEKPARSLKILVAEDNDTTRYLMTAMMSRLGHAVDAVENGAQALEKTKSRPYDIILMDMQMPVMDGVMATRAIRALDGKRAKVPIIALTADAIAEHRQGYLNAGLDAVVTKPVDWTVLAIEMERLLPHGDGGDILPIEGIAAPTPNPDGELPILDDSALSELREALGDDVVKPMLFTFATNMDQYETDLSAALAAGDLKQAKRTAHALKGLCAQFGASRVSALAKTIEIDSKSVEEISQMMPLLAQTLTSTRGELAGRHKVKSARA